MIKVGITGSIGTGKSLAANFFKQKGYQVISADEINNNLYQDEKVVRKVNRMLFKEDSAVLNKSRIAQVIFNNSDQKQLLESYLHPLIYQKMEMKINELNEKIVFLEIPLLYETNFKELCEYVIVMYTNLNTQIKRISQRDKISEGEARKRIAKQMDLAEKVSLADYVIDNNLSIENTENLLEKWLEEFRRINNGNL